MRLWGIDELRSVIREAADTEGVDPNLALALTQTESAFNPWATRYEPRFSRVDKLEEQPRIMALARRNMVSVETERAHQRTSWGLMQVLGHTARELGYEGPLPMLVDPQMSARWGVEKIKSLQAKYESEDHVISGYNIKEPLKVMTPRGLEFPNQSYVDKVKAALKKLRGF